MSDNKNQSLEQLRRAVLLQRLQQRGGKLDPAEAAIPIADRSRALPLSLAQQRLWFLDQLDKSASTSYQLPVALRLTGKLDADALQATLDRVVARHEILRTRFISVDGIPYQEIAPAASGFALKREACTEADVARITNLESQEPFDLQTGPLIRGRLLQLANDEHVLLITQHHIITDGWSMGILVREVATLYAAFHNGQADPLPALDIQYADYARWQRNWLQGEELTRQLQFWRDHLSGAPALLELPLDRPRPAVQAHAGGVVPFTLSPSLTAALQSFSQRHGVTLFMTLLSAWGLLLSRLSGQQDVVVGTAVANRQRREVEGLIGFFVNTLGLRLRFDEQATLAELLAQVKETTLSAFAHQELPFEQVVEAVQPQRSLAHSPLFQSLFSLNNTPPAGAQELPGLKLAPVERVVDSTHFDLSLSLTMREDRLDGVIGYVSALFDRETVERWAGYYEHLLQALAAGTAERIQALPLLSSEEEQRLRVQSAGPIASDGRATLLPQQIEAQAARTPDAIALRSGDHTLTYAKFNASANRLAHSLIARDVTRGSRVGVQMGRSVDLMIAKLAIMKTGAAYVPLDPKQASERHASIVRDAGIEIVLTNSEAVGADHNPNVAIDANDTIYVLYTSGSTGEPKGVEVHHGGVADYCTFARNNYYGAELQGSLVATSPAFDLTLPALYVPLLTGGCVNLLPEEDELEALSVSLAKDASAVLLRLTPSHVQALLTLSDAAPRHSAHAFVIGGEVFAPALARALQAKFPNARIYNHYGPTETVVGCAWFDVTKNIDALGTRIPIGRPMENTSLYVLDAQGRLQPPGVPGELYIGGAGVTKGYLNRAELTAQKFVANPFGEGRLYRSGDQVRWTSNGHLEFLGRVDRQVKLRGFRIELGEIENRLERSAHVREAVVRLWDEQLVAYVVGDGDEAAVQEQLASQLPAYMLPAAYVWLDAFPLTVNGKVDIHALPAPELSAVRTREYEAPQGEIEQTIAELWQSLLRLDPTGRNGIRAGRNDSFFELGGHSLLAVQLVSRIRAVLGVELPLRALFANPTVRAIADLVRNANASTMGRIEPADRNQPLPLSLAQQRLWFLDQLDKSASAAYHMPAALRLRGRLDIEALQATLNSLIARHESLRTRFVAIDGIPYQQIAQPAPFALMHEDLRDLPQNDREARVAQITNHEAQQAFDLTNGPLIRGRLLTLASDEHVLLITQHHIVSDGWSIGVLVREVAALYTAFCRGENDPLPALEIQYPDYAQWQRGWLQGEELARQLGFWKDHLSGAPSLLSLPLDRPRPAVQSHAGSTVPLLLPAELTANLRELSQRHGVTVFMTLLAAWGVLLSRLSGQDDVVIGTPVANRQRREVEDLIGFFVNTLALRVRLDEGTTVEGLLRQIKETSLAAFAHQELPFEQVVEAVQPQRSLSHSPLFQTMLAFNNARNRTALQLPELTLEPVERDGATTHFELSAGLSDQGNAIGGVLEYASDLFDRTTIERWASHFVNVLEAMVANPAADIATLPLLSSAEREQVLDAFNATAADFAHDELIHERIERQAAAQPDAIAVVLQNESLTYAALNARANQLAHELIALGVGPDDRVAICVERSLDMVAGLVAILKAGGAYLPLDPAYPAERLQYTLHDGAPKALLTQAALQEQLQLTGVPTLLLDRVDVSTRSTANPQVPNRTADNLGYVIYTSGSTGLPKGVAMPQSALQNLLDWQERDNTPGQSGRNTVQYSALGFDVAFQEIFSTLTCGGTLVLLTEDLRRDPLALLEYLRAKNVHRLFLPFVALNTLAEAASRHNEALPSLQHVITAGEQLVMTPAIRAFLAAAPGCRLHNHYGPTESHVVTALVQTESHNDWPELPPIGRPIANSAIYILDARRQPVPIGVSGEIYIGGVQVARGYLNRPELTAERFIPNPFAEGRLYKTGDLGRWLPNGNIEYLGRNDFQLKIRGFRIELGEIEAKLGACADVREAVVIARQDVPGDKRLVAYVVAGDGVAVQAAELRAALLRQLPEYMVPSAFVQLEAMPLSPNGKLDRKALPASDAASLSTREYEAPQGVMEEKLAAIWCDLLRVDRAGRHDAFFELGGHSLLAVQLVSRIRTEIGVDIALREVFVHPSLRALAEVVREAGASTLGAIPRADRSARLPLSLAQQRLWFLDQLDKSASAAYHISAALRLTGTLDVDALQATLDRLVARHEGLRTRFVVVDGEPVQEIAPEDCGLALQRRDLGVHESIEQLAAEEARAPFDLSAGPLIRGQLLRVSGNEHILLITQHHIVTDGWSLGILVREVAALYTAYRNGGADPLPPLDIQYADYAQWQRNWLQGEELARQLEFWKQQLAGAPALLELPLDHARPALQSHAGGAVPFRLSPESTARLQAFSQRHGVTLFMTLLSAWGVLLSRLSGQRDVVIGTSVANRQRREVEGLIGFFVNTLALRLRLDEQPTLASLLAQVKETTLAAFSHQELPFEQVVEAVQPQRSLSHSPLFQALFSFNNTPDGGALELPELTLAPVARKHDTTHFDLSLSIGVHGDTVGGTLGYATALFDHETIVRWAAHYEILLDAIVADADAQADALPLLTAAQQDALLAQSAGPVSTEGRAMLLPQQIEAQAARTPHALALRSGDRTLTYEEFNASANRLAHSLIAQGVTRGSRVGVQMGRGIDLMIAKLAIMKTGAAYVPLDPKQASERHASIVRDASIEIVLTNSEAVGPDHNPDVAINAGDTIYVLYTSGSTGEPKGVEVHHGGVADYCAFARNNYYGAELQGSLVATSPAFDLTLPALYVPLLTGGCVNLLPEEDELEALSASLAKDDAAVLLRLTPSHVQALLTLSDAAPRNSAHAFVIGGEVFAPALARALQAKFPSARIYNHYGPTETVVGCAWFDVTKNLAALDTRIPIGRPMENTALYVLDERGQLQPPGVPGELYIGGAGVTKGYLNRAELTAQKFVANPFGEGRLYRSGDRVRWTANGHLEFLGRVDRQVKLRGFRIELGEIENRLEQSTHVREAVVRLYDDQLVAYCTGDRSDAVHEQLATQLPSYMLPAAYVWLDAFPLTVNGKVDINALPAPELRAREYEAPQGAVEETIAEVWQTLLHVERVGRQDNFFELGGHSLLAVSLVGRLRERGFALPVRDVFTEPTLQALAARVEATSDTSASDEAAPLVQLEAFERDAIAASIGADNIQDLYGLSPLQEGILFHHLLQEQGDAYLSRRMLAFATRERLDDFLAALGRVIARHDSLRTAFRWQGLAAPVQVVCREVQLPVEELQLSAPVLANLVEATDPRHRRLDLTQAPLMAACIAGEPDGSRWYLALFSHHLITDHLSSELLIAEIDAVLAGRESTLPAPLPYRDFIAQTQRQSAADHDAFFRAALADIDEPTIPFGIVDTQGSGATSVETKREVPADLAARIHEAARRERVSPAVLFHAAWALVVGRLSGREDVVFGSVFSGRQGMRGGDRAVGMFMNTLPLRLSLRGSVQDAVRETAASLAGLLDHEQAPLSVAQRASGVRPPLPLFTALLNYRHSSSTADRDFASLSNGIELLEAGERNNFPMTMSVGDLGGDFVLTALTIPGIDGALLCRSLLTVTDALVAKLESDPQHPFAELPSLPEADRTRLLHGFNATDVDHGTDHLIHERFERYAASQPDAIAVVCGDEQLTYAALNARANQVAHGLIAHGVQPDDRVALRIERSIDMVVAILGVLKSGAAYLPLDPAHPAERQAYMLEDGAPKALLTREALAAFDDQPQANPAPRANADHLAYVLYTSGSTGRPKGVAVPHRAANSYFAFAIEQYLPGIAGTVVSSPLTFDATLTTLVVPFLAGRRCILLSEDTDALLAQLLAAFRGSEPLLFKLTPAHLELLANLADAPVAGVPHRVVVGGEQLSRHTLRKFRERVLPDAVVINEYGPTETVVGCTTHVCDDGDGIVPIGKPIANARIYVLDAHGQPVPEGVAGEIYIGGAGVARGYLNRETLTAERFLANPFDEGRMYKTGDLARWLPNGELEYLGRNDFQVKIRGFRIELGEIEARLSKCEGVREAAVIAREDIPGDKRLVAYVVGSIADLREQLASQLPDYMVPSAFVQLDALPLTSNGKLDRNALPAPDATSTREYEAPIEGVETKLASIWQQVLHVDRVGRHDDFFELGGHSLLAVQLISRLRAELDVELPLRDVFTKPTLSALAEAVRGAAPAAFDAIPPADRTQRLPLSLAQQRLWFLDQLDKAASAAYHMPSALRLTGALDADALQATLDRVVARHEILRTRFVAQDGVPYQVIDSADRGFSLKREDCTEADVERITNHELTEPFDLEHGPLVRGRLLKLGEDEHVLLITQHHIVSDGWSINVMIREVAALYAAFLRGESDPLPALDLQYADYGQWQRARLAGDALAQQTGFWKEHLTGAPALLRLPLDRPRPAVQSHAGARVAFRLPEELAAELRAFAQRHGVTLFMTLMAAWSLLLARLSGQTDVVVGTPVANRQRRELESLIGFFVNTLALRTRLEDRPTLGALLAQAKETTLAAFAHADLPFEQVVEAVQPQRSLSYSPLFQSVFAFNNTNTSGENVLTLPGLTLAPVKSKDDTTHFDLSLSMADAGGELAGALEYASDLFDRTTVERWTRSFVELLRSMVAAGATTIADTLPILTSEERIRLVETFNAAASYDVPAFIHERIEAHAAAQPDAIAVVSHDEQLTYAELNARANQLAHELIARGVEADDRVAILLDRGLDLIVAMLGVLKAGGAYLPIDPAYPAERIESMLADAQPKAVLTHDALRQSPIANHPTHNPQLPTSNTALAYVIYTSGSTGTPKGVMVEHHNLANMAMAHAATFGVTPASRVLQFVSPAFDVCAAEVFMTLGAGATLHVAEREQLLPGEPLQTILRERAVTHVLLPAGVAALVEPRDLPALTHLIVGGDVCPPALAERWLGKVQFFNAYGPTETSVCATVQHVTDVHAHTVPIGRPFGNARLFILDVNRELVPVGVEGEIHIGGAGVARGYLDRSELTAERFVTTSFGRLYKTGDLGRWLPDGTIEYAGRNDFQVKIRGFRIELGEIEARLAACAGVTEAAVIARDQRLIAYVTGDAQANDLRVALAAQLPKYMVPSAFVMLDAMPLTSNGKLDRNALPEVEAATFGVREYEAPRGGVEATLANVWQELLHAERVGRSDDFFALGGHSLLAAQLVSRVRAAFDVELPLREVFASSTLAAMADAVRAAGASTMQAIPRADRTQELPLSLAQQRLWFLDRLDKAASAAYHMPAALRLTGTLDIDALQQTLDRLVARHESLRTTFTSIDGVPYQQIAPETTGFALRRETCTEEDVERIINHESRTPFDLERGPLVRGRLLKIADDQHVLVITQHHIISDGWSVNVMVREVAALYAAFTRGESDPLPPLGIQYADYAQWQRQWLEGDTLAQQTGFWKSHLIGAPALLSLPLDRPRPAVQSHAGGRVPVILSESLTTELRAFAQRHGATMFMTLLSAWGALLSRLSGQTDVVIGTPVANRQSRELEGLIGFFVNTLALRLRLDESPAVDALLAQAKETTLAAFAHQDLPFEQVVEAVQPQRSLSHSPLFQTLFAFNNTSGANDGALELPGLTLAPVKSADDRAHFDLSLTVAEREGRLAGAIEYASDLFDRTTVERWAGYFVNLLEAMTAHASDAAGTLPILPSNEREQLLHTFNVTEGGPAGDALLHELFEQHAAAQPGAIAAIFEDQQLTYAELDARANQVAHHLIAAGVQQDDRVAILMDRGLDLIVAMLGVLKAGAAYLPLDPSYPADRLRFMQEDAAPKAVLTEEALRACATRPATNPRVRVAANHVAYVIYTSGSTGLPKGVLVEHRGLANLAHAQSLMFGVTPQSRVLQFSSSAFDASVWEIAMTLSRGATLCLAPRAALMPGEPLETTMRELRITHATLPSSALIACGDVDFPSLECLVVAGDVCPPALAQRWQNRLRFFNAYGPTETTVCATAQLCTEPYADIVPIGPPIANLKVYILDAHHQPVPLGVEGEIYIGGAGVARGYLNRPELTAERFVANPFAEGTMYKTGDRGRWLPTGTVEYLGRSDFQVKIRGFRIELGEIEAKLQACAGIRDVAVIAREDVPGDKRLVAYLVGEGELSVSDLRAALSAELPDYMIPAAFVRLEMLPLNANGKVDRKQLPAPDAAAVNAREYEAPIGAVETALATLWQDLLHVERVGRHDHFFELGGHSLLVVTMVERLRALGLSGDVRAVFTAPVLSDYARTLQTGVAEIDAVPANLLTPATTHITPELLPLITLTQPEIDRIVASVPGGAANVQDIYPLLPLQEGMLFHHLLETEGDTYLSRNLIAFDSRERLHAFLTVLERLIARHDVMRTAVLWDGLGTPAQVVYRDASLPVELVEIGPDGDAREVLLGRTDPKHTRLDLQQAPLLAAFVAEDTARGEWALSLLSHHMVCDHATLDLVMAEVRALLAGETQPLVAPMPLRNLVAQATQVPASAHEDYFREQLGGIDAPTAPFGILDVQVKTAELETAGMRIDGDFARRLRDASSQLGVPPSVLFHVAWAQVLARCTGRDEIVFGTVLSGRLQGAAGADRALGMFINTLPLRITMSGDARDVVRSSYERMISLLAHEQAPLSTAQRCSGVPAPLPLFTTLLNYRHSADSRETAAAQELEGIRLLSVHEAVNYPLAVAIDDFGRDFALKVQGLRTLNVERMTAYYITALQSLLALVECGGPASAFEILPAEERTQLLEEFNATSVEYPQDLLLHDLVSQFAQTTPDHPAVLFEQTALTYRELDVRANQLAHALLAMGIEPEDRVAVAVERGLELAVALTGIFKAGATYLPLDPAYPADRLQYMLGDAAPKVVLTQQHLRAQLPAAGVPVLAFDADDFRATLAAQPSHAPGANVTRGHVAYVIYTSGSTGRPKGVMVEHGGLVNLAYTFRDTFAMTPESRVLQFASAAFDASISEFAMAFGAGATLCLAPRPALMPGEALETTMREMAITHVTLPSIALSASGDANFPALQYLIVAGDACPPALVERWHDKLHFFNGYGPTENTVCATLQPCTEVYPDTVPIGRPMSNARVYILDAHRRLAPIGVEGEIYIAGAGLARGYLNRPELTAERFVANPFHEGRMYKTGDLGRWLPDGTIEYRGRNDFQVKIRGFRIELGEIEAKLAQCAGVREAAVIAREDAPGDKRLVAYLVANENATLQVSELRASLAAELPDYMLPSAYVQLDAIPVTTNGKLDRKALPAPETAALSAREYEAPVGEIEQTVAAVWQELLKVPRVGRHDNFFELGGHSLLAVRIMAALNARLELQVSIRDVFESATVSALAACLQQHKQLSALRSDLALADSLDQAPPELVEI